MLTLDLPSLLSKGSKSPPPLIVLNSSLIQKGESVSPFWTSDMHWSSISASFSANILSQRHASWLTPFRVIIGKKKTFLTKTVNVGDNFEMLVTDPAKCRPHKVTNLILSTTLLQLQFRLLVTNGEKSRKITFLRGIQDDDYHHRQQPMIHHKRILIGRYHNPSSNIYSTYTVVHKDHRFDLVSVHHQLHRVQLQESSNSIRNLWISQWIHQPKGQTLRLNYPRNFADFGHFEEKLPLRQVREVNFHCHKSMIVRYHRKSRRNYPTNCL